jgi:UDP-glucose 4-epimerase
MALYLVTGGAGFIGSHIVVELVQRGDQVRVLDDFSTGKRENLQSAVDLRPSAIDVIEGDVRDLETVRRAMADADYVLHQAAVASVPRSVADPLTTNEVNVTGTLNVLIAAREAQGAGMKRLVYASSSAVYGNNPVLPKREDMPAEPLSPYAVSKLAGENYCRAFHEVYGLPTVALRYFNAFGPRQDPTSQYAAVIPQFITRMLRGEPPIIHGDGLQSRDFIYVADVVQANLAACQAEAAVGQVCNVASGERVNLLELVEALNEVLGTDLRPTFDAPRPGDVRHSVADISRLRELTGWEEQVSLAEGLRRTVEWYNA